MIYPEYYLNAFGLLIPVFYFSKQYCHLSLVFPRQDYFDEYTRHYLSWTYEMSSVLNETKEQKAVRKRARDFIVHLNNIRKRVKRLF